MDSKKLECRQCHGTEVLRRDSQTGMWELMIGHASISNSSWQYLEETWLDIHHRGCKERQSQRLYCAWCQHNPQSRGTRSGSHPSLWMTGVADPYPYNMTFGRAGWLRFKRAGYSECQNDIPMGCFVKSPFPPFPKGGMRGHDSVARHSFGTHLWQPL